MSEKKGVPIWLLPMFIILAILLIANSSWEQRGDTTAIVDSSFVSTNYVRDPLQEPIFTKLKMEYKCNNCHDHFKTKGDGNGGLDKQLVGDHRTLELHHGANDSCLNCHHRDNREAFVNHDGSEIPYNQSVDLCRKCHGPKYNDWVKGVHGRPTGFWDAKAGESIKGICIQCHDPHSPKFKAIKPAPKPQSKVLKEEVH